MYAVYILCPVLLIAGLFNIFGLNPVKAAKRLIRLSSVNHKSDWKELRKKALRKYSPDFISRQINDTKFLLHLTHRDSKYDYFRKLSFILAFTGALCGIIIGNPLLAAVLMICGLLIPSFIVQGTAITFKKRANYESVTVMSIISATFMRTNDFVLAVEENISHINPPMNYIFRRFLKQVKLIDPDIKKGIDVIRPCVDSNIWREWCDTVKLCIDDPVKKKALESVIKEAEMYRSSQNELTAENQSPITAVIVMIALDIISVPVFSLIYRDWSDTMLHTPQGWFGISAIAAAMMYAIYRIIKISRPLGEGRV